MKKSFVTIISLWLLFTIHLYGESRSVQLSSGYNAVYFNKTLTVEVLQEQIGFDNLLVVQGAGQGKAYKKSNIDAGLPFLNSFSETALGEAYWIKVQDAVEITYDEDTYSGTKTIPLNVGWNFVGPLYSKTIAEITDEVGADNLLIIQGAGQGRAYKKSNIDAGLPFLNSFTAFEENQGYWVKVVEGSQLTFTFELDQSAKDNTFNDIEVTQQINNKDYVIKVFSDRLPVNEISQDTISMYGMINGEQVVMSLNGSYEEGSLFQIEVSDLNNNEFARSSLVTFSVDPINFGEITFDDNTTTVFKNFDGYLYVANEGAGGGGGTTIFKVDGNGTASLLADGFQGPSGLAVDGGTQTLYISDDRNQVYRLLQDGNFSVLPIDSSYLSNPNALVLDSYGYLLIANAGAGTIVRVDPNNTSDIQVIAQGFNVPQAVEIYHDMAYFTDFSNKIYEVNVSTATPVTPATALYKDMSSYVFGTQGGLMSDFNGSLFMSSYDSGEVFKVDAAKNVTKVYEKSGSQPRGLLYVNDTLYITLYNEASVVRVDMATLSSEVFSDDNSSAVNYSGPFGIRVATTDYPTFDGANPYVDDGGDDNSSESNVSLPSGFIYDVINNLGESVTLSGEYGTIKLFANYEEVGDDQQNHVGISVNLDGESLSTVQVQNTYRTQEIVAALYDVSGELLSVSSMTYVDEVSPVTVVSIVTGDNGDNNSTEEDFSLADVQNKLFYTVTLKNGIASKGKVDFFTDTRTFYFYSEDNNSYYEKDTASYSLDGVDIHVSSQILNQEFNFNKVPKDGSPAIFVADIILDDSTYFGTRHFFTLEADADAYISSLNGNNNDLVSRIVGTTQYYVTEAGAVGVRTYSEMNDTYTGHIRLSNGNEFDTAGTYSIDGDVVTINRASPSMYNLLLTYTGEEGGSLSFDVAVNGGANSSSAVWFTTLEARDAYINNNDLASKIVGSTQYFATETGVVGVRTYSDMDDTYTGRIRLANGTEFDVAGIYTIDGDVVTINRTSPSTFNLLLTYEDEEAGGLTFNEGSVIWFTTMEARDAYIAGNIAFTREMLNQAGRVWNVYPERNETTGERYWEGGTFEFDLSRLRAEHHLLSSVTTPELDTDYNITESGELTFYFAPENEIEYISIVEMNETRMTICWSDTPNNTCNQDAYEYFYFDLLTAQDALDRLNGKTPSVEDTNLTAAMRILENINFETDDIDIALTEARELLESADASDKEAQVGLALFALAEITNSSEVSDLIDVNLEGTYDYYDNLPKVLSADANPTIDLIENLTTFSEISTTVLHNTAQQLVVIASAFEDVFSDTSYVFTYDDINITLNQSLAIRSGLLVVASQLEYVASFRNLTAEDIKPRELISENMNEMKSGAIVEYNNISSNPVSVLNRTDVGSLENAERLGNAKTLLINSISLLTAIDASQEDVNMQADIVEAQERALEVNASLHGVASFVIENTNYTKVEKIYLNLSAMYEEASVLDMTHTVGHDFSYESRDEYFSGQGYRTGEYNLSISREYNEPMSAVWISEENGTALPYIVYQMPRPNLEVVPTIPTGSDSHIPLVVTKVEVIENNETVNYIGDDILRYFFNYIDLYSENQQHHYQRSEDINITFSVDGESMIAYDSTPTHTFEFNGPDWMHMVEVNGTTVRVVADAGESGGVSYSITVTDNFGHSEERWYYLYIETPNATIELSENNIAVNQGDTKTVTITTEYVNNLHLLDAPGFVTLNGNEISINPTSDTAITHYEIMIEGTNSLNNGVVNQFLQIDVNGDSAGVSLPDGYIYRGINNLGTELQTAVDLNAIPYTLRIYSDTEVIANDQATHVGIFMNINGQSALLQIQPKTPDYNIVVAVYDDTGALVAVSDITAVNENTPISVSF